jgi:hypothetical protein
VTQAITEFPKIAEFQTKKPEDEIKDSNLVGFNSKLKDVDLEQLNLSGSVFESIVQQSEPEEQINVSYSDLAGLLSSHNLEASSICQLTPSITSDAAGRKALVNSVYERVSKMTSKSISDVNRYKNEHTFKQLENRFEQKARVDFDGKKS